MNSMLCNIKQYLLKALWTRSRAWTREASCLQWPINTFLWYAFVYMKWRQNSVGRSVDLLSFRINFVGFSDDDNLFLYADKPTKFMDNLERISTWNSTQKSCHWTKSVCATLRDDTVWINKNQFQSETCHLLQEWTVSRPFFESIDITRNVSIWCRNI